MLRFYLFWTECRTRSPWSSAWVWWCSFRWVIWEFQRTWVFLRCSIAFHGRAIRESFGDFGTFRTSWSHQSSVFAWCRTCHKVCRAPWSLRWCRCFLKLSPAPWLLWFCVGVQCQTTWGYRFCLGNALPTWKWRLPVWSWTYSSRWPPWAWCSWKSQRSSSDSWFRCSGSSWTDLNHGRILRS